MPVFGEQSGQDRESGENQRAMGQGQHSQEGWFCLGECVCVCVCSFRGRCGLSEGVSERVEM